MSFDERVNRLFIRRRKDESDTVPERPAFCGLLAPRPQEPSFAEAGRLVRYQRQGHDTSHFRRRPADHLSAGYRKIDEEAPLPVNLDVCGRRESVALCPLSG